MEKSTLSVSKITRGYPGRPVISDFDLNIGPGLTGMLGPNGAGKTTLLKVLATVTPPSEGTVTICGEKVANYKALQEARQKIGYLPQDFGYHANFTVREFVRYSAWLRLIKKDVETKVSEAIEIAGLSDRSKSKLKSLSGGMLQRAGIAAAIVGYPPVIILDEPTVGLDPQQRLQFRRLLRELDSSAVILSTHLIEDVAAVCDRVSVIVGGRLEFDGTVEQLSDMGSQDQVGLTRIEQGYMNILGVDGAA